MDSHLCNENEGDVISLSKTQTQAGAFRLTKGFFSFAEQAISLGVQYVDGEVRDASVESKSRSSHFATAIQVLQPSGHTLKIQGRHFVNAGLA